MIDLSAEPAPEDRVPVQDRLLLSKWSGPLQEVLPAGRSRSVVNHLASAAQTYTDGRIEPALRERLQLSDIVHGDEQDDGGAEAGMAEQPQQAQPGPQPFFHNQAAAAAAAAVMTQCAGRPNLAAALAQLAPPTPTAAVRLRSNCFFGPRRVPAAATAEVAAVAVEGNAAPDAAELVPQPPAAAGPSSPLPLSRRFGLTAPPLEQLAFPSKKRRTSQSPISAAATTGNINNTEAASASAGGVPDGSASVVLAPDAWRVDEETTCQQAPAASGDSAPEPSKLSPLTASASHTDLASPSGKRPVHELCQMSGNPDSGMADENNLEQQDDEEAPQKLEHDEDEDSLPLSALFGLSAQHARQNPVSAAAKPLLRAENPLLAAVNQASRHSFTQNQTYAAGAIDIYSGAEAGPQTSVLYSNQENALPANSPLSRRSVPAASREISGILCFNSTL